jgi:hypothetical protein
MCVLPKTDQPLPDEILGSWFRHLALYNGRGAWAPLLEQAGYWGTQTGPLFNLVKFDEKIASLLEACGWTYEKALLKLTTYLYWLEPIS